MLQENKDSFATREVQIFPYDPQWKVEFEKIKGMITRYAGEYFSAIEHVGSTSVEGLGAKPIIDLDAVPAAQTTFPKSSKRCPNTAISIKVTLGCRAEAFFRPRDYNAEEKSVMRYHLYVCLPDAKPYREHLAFRDYLRCHPNTRKEYQQLKVQLAQQYRFDVDAYCEHKTEFVRSILRRCGY